MMKWKVTKNSRSSSVDRSVDCPITEDHEPAKFLTPLAVFSKTEHVSKENELLLPPGRCKQLQQQNGGARLTRKDSFAASDCIPLNLKGIFGISRQRSESNLNSVSSVNGEHRRSRSEVRMSSTDRLTVAYHSSLVTAPQNRLSERNKLRTDKQMTTKGRSSSPPMKNSRWLRGRQRQRDPKKAALGVCGGVSKAPTPPNDVISYGTADLKNKSRDETLVLPDTSSRDHPKENKEPTDKEKLHDSVASRLNGDAEKDHDKENISIRRKPTNENIKAGKEGCKLRRNKGFAPRPGMKRSQNENDKTSSAVDTGETNKPDGRKSNFESPPSESTKKYRKGMANSIESESTKEEFLVESKSLDCKPSGVLNFLKDFDGCESKPIAKKRRDSTDGVVGLSSETFSLSQQLDDSRQQSNENKPKTLHGEKNDLIQKYNERNTSATPKNSEPVGLERKVPKNSSLNGGDEFIANGNKLLYHNNAENEESTCFKVSSFDLQEETKNSNEDLQRSYDESQASHSKKSNNVRNSPCITKSSDKNPSTELSAMVEDGKEVLKNPKDTLQEEECQESLYANVRHGDLREYESISEEHTIHTNESKDRLTEIILHSLDVGGQTDSKNTAMDTCSKVKTYYPPTPPPKKKIASHQGMTVSVVVRKPSTSEECKKSLSCKEPEISAVESFVVKKSFVLTIAKQEMGFRSLCANKESSQALETAAAGVKKEEHQISVTFLCSESVKKPWLDRHDSVSSIDDVRLRSFSMPPISRYQTQDMLCLQSIRSRSRERKIRDKQSSKKKSHRQRKKDPGFHMPKAVIDELSKVLEKRKRSVDDEDDEDEDEDDDFENHDSE